MVRMALHIVHLLKNFGSLNSILSLELWISAQNKEIEFLTAPSSPPSPFDFNFLWSNAGENVFTLSEHIHESNLDI